MKAPRWKFKAGDKIQGVDRTGTMRIIARVTEDKSNGYPVYRYKVFALNLTEFKEIDKVIIETFYKKASKS